MITIWHNPRCSKSREALRLLEAQGAELTVRRYLEAPPSAEELQSAQAALGRPPAEMIRKGEKTFRELGLSLQDAPERLLQAMADHPILIERPVVFGPRGAVIARPPERALEVL